MNSWTIKSMKLAYQQSYIDNLLDIYPIRANPRRDMPESLWSRISDSYNNNNGKELIKVLNKAVKSKIIKFPIECYYAPCFRNEENWIDLNPIAIDSIGQLLLDLDIDVIYDRCTEPKKVSRQVGSMFTDWFSHTFSGVANINLLGTSDTNRKQIANRTIDYYSPKGLDVFIRIGDIFLLGEAKFISTSGGTQLNQFRSAIDIINTFRRETNVIPLTIIDGSCWRKANDIFYNSIINSQNNHIIISALLLEDLFKKVMELDVAGEELPNDEIIRLVSN